MHKMLVDVCTTKTLELYGINEIACVLFKQQSMKQITLTFFVTQVGITISVAIVFVERKFDLKVELFSGIC
jgi:hypothetical protein